MKRFILRLPTRASRMFQYMKDAGIGPVKPPEETEDGGPGSGNWGHRGRPGLVGGSGKGGGTQYRGGRGDIRYHGSRGDWMNGLLGERQHEAQSWIQRLRQNYSQPEEKGKSVEQNIMEDPHPGSESVRAKLLGFMAEARNWGKHAKRLIDENLDDDERKLVETLANKYGLAYVGGATIPDDVDTSQWDKEDLRCWQDLKSKAMVGPTSGKEPPDELMYEAGLKERPTPPPPPPEPKKPEIPATPEDNNEWFENLGPNREGIMYCFRQLGIDPYKFSGIPDIEQAERKMLNNGGILDVELYLDLKDRSLGDQFISSVAAMANGDPDAPAHVGRLAQDVSVRLSAFFEFMAEESGLKGPYSAGDYSAAEALLLGDKNVPDTVKRSLLYLKASALGYPSGTFSQHTHSNVIIQYMREQKAQKKVAKEQGQGREVFEKGKEERKKKYAEATTASGVAAILNTSGIFNRSAGAGASLNGCDPEVAKDVAASYERVAEKFPFLIGKLGSLTENERGLGTYACCHTMAGGGVDINAASKFFGSKEGIRKSYEEDVATLWHPPGTDYTAVVTHELGHSLDGFLTKKGILGSTGYTYASGFSGILRRRVAKALGMSVKTCDAAVSRYAMENPREWFAECFAEAMHSPNPRPVAKEMMRQLNAILREEGLIDA